MDLKELKKLVRVCRKLGVNYIKNNEIELQIGDKEVPVVKRAKRKVIQDESLEPVKEFSLPSMEEILFYSSNAMDGALNEDHS